MLDEIYEALDQLKYAPRGCDFPAKVKYTNAINDAINAIEKIEERLKYQPIWKGDDYWQSLSKPREVLYTIKLNDPPSGLTARTYSAEDLAWDTYGQLSLYPTPYTKSHNQRYLWQILNY